MKQTIQNHKPSFDEERLLWQQGFKYIAGVDEVGRGAFAGPVVAAAVILPIKFPRIDEINDSKVIPSKKRKELALIIHEHALSFAIAEVSVAVINKIGIGKATQLAFRRCVSRILYQVSCINNKEIHNTKYIQRNTNHMIHTTSSFVLVDGFPIVGVPKNRQKAIIKGDSKSISIAAASIIAKVYRDNLMQGLSQKYHQYHFAVHKGYGTKFHRDAIKEYGLCKLHRTSFKIQKYILY